MYEPATAPQSIGGTLDRGFQLFKASFRYIVPLAFVAALINALPGLYLRGKIAEAMPDPTQEGNFAEPVFSGTLIGLFIGITLLSLIIYAAIITRLDAVAKNTDCSMAAAIVNGIRRAPALLGVSVLFGLILSVGFLLLVVPGIIVSVSLYGAFYLVVTDKLGPIAALSESHRLVWGDWWRTATILTVSLIIAGTFYLLIGVVGGVFIIAGADTNQPAITPWWFDALLTPAITAVITPLVYAIPYAMLQDLKLRRSGSDLQTRMESLEQA